MLFQIIKNLFTLSTFLKLYISMVAIYVSIKIPSNSKYFVTKLTIILGKPPNEKNVTKSGKSQRKKSKSPKFEIWTF